MSAFENFVIGKSSIPSLIITVILMIAIPVISFLYWRKRHKQQTRISWLIAGAVGFLVSARVLELGIHYFCIIADNPVSRFLNGNTAAFILYGITMAGVFEECGRYVILKYICPECHEVFKPTLKEAFFANHTPAARKLTCTSCAHKGFCVEIWGGDDE